MQSKTLIRIITLFTWVLVTLVPLVPSAADAADFNYDTQVNYKVNADNTANVTETYRVINHTSRQYLSSIKLSTAAETVSGVVAKYDDGTKISFSIIPKQSTRGDISYSYIEIDLTFPRQNYGNGRAWTFSVSYLATGLVDGKGGNHTVFVPAIDAGDIGDDYSVTVDVPLSFGSAHFSGAAAASGGVSGDRQYYNFAKTDLVAHSLALNFGDVTVYETNFNFPLRNDTPFPKTFTITLPPDLNNQKSYVNRLNPAPFNTRLDDDGNVLADYHLAPHQQLIIKTEISGEVHYLEYDLSNSGKKSDIPADLVRRYTNATQYWSTGGAVAEQTRKLVDDNAPVAINVKAIYQFVIGKLSYNKDKIKFNIRQGAANALAHPGNAVCLEYADLTIAMLRSAGIPARMPVGYGFSDSLKNSDSVADSLHAWVEAYIPGVGWMTLDPTWGEKFDEFGKSDLDHFAFAVWGASDQSPDAVMAGNVDLNYQYEQATVGYAAKATPQVGAGTVAVKRWVLLPYLSLDRVTVQAQAQVATDHNQVTIGATKLDLGSLAPSEKATVNHFVLGKHWNQSDKAQFGQGNTVVLSASQVKISYIPMFVILGIVLIAAALGVVLRLRPKPDEDTHESEAAAQTKK